jgi:hypothetical protein
MIDDDPARGPGGAMPFQRCALCGVGTAAWMHRLDWDKARFRVYGKGHTWAHEVAVCERCERLYRAGDDDGLLAVHERSWQKSAEGVEEGIRNSLLAFRRADVGAVSMAEWLPPGVADAVRDGFVPIDDLLGEDWVIALWPLEHRRALPETRPGWVESSDDGMVWLVRSPWPEVPVEEAVRLMWEWVYGRRSPRTGRVTAEGDAAWQALTREFLHLDVASVLDFRSSVDRPK